MAWLPEELSRIGDSTELQLASSRPNGTLSPFTTMWVVRSGDDLYVRSAGGPTRPWYRRARASGSGHIRGGGVEADVTFADARPEAHDALDAEYHLKYDRYGSGPVGAVTGDDAHNVTIRLVKSEQ